MFGSKSGQFDRYLERATSQLLLEPDWDSILQICDCIRQNDVQPKWAVGAIRRKITHENPHVSMFALQVLESCVKNCGSSVHEEIASKEFMEFFKDLVKKKNDPVKGKILELIQCWSHAFRNEPSYKIVQDTFHLMKMEGYQFPVLKEADAMFMAEKAPEWMDGDTCHRCRVQFSTFQRKHHCRNCGQVFCNKCSSKNSIIPRFGIEREVRVCDACFDQLNKAVPQKEDGLPQEYLNSPLSQQSQVGTSAPPKKTEAEIQEEEELQLALALSMSEAAEKEKQRERMKVNYTPPGVSSSPAASKETSQPEPVKVSATALDTSDMDPELARYLNRNYWEQKHEDLSKQPSAPTSSVDKADISAAKNGGAKNDESFQNGESSEQGRSSDADETQFLNAVNSSIQIFVNRMKSNSQRGRSIANDSSVQTLFMTLNSMHPQLMTYIQKQEDNRTYYESLQDKLAQLKDAREALNDLREEHREKRRREQEELERQRQVAMAARLEKLRQKKQEYLEYQRQLAMQRMQEQEREMQMRLEQQKQMQQMRAMQYGSMAPPPQMYGAPVTYSPAGSTEGSPHHQPPPPGSQYPGAPGGMMYAPPPQQYGAPPPPMQGHMQQQPGPAGVAPASGGYMPPPPPGGYGPPPPQGGQPQPGGYDYYNMTGMQQALPGGPPSGPPGPPGQFLPPPSSDQPLSGQYAPPDQQQQQHQQHPAQQTDSQLICFD